eukprot:363512-Chlamydomonas_euryale.AAC.2
MQGHHSWQQPRCLNMLSRHAPPCMGMAAAALRPRSPSCIGAAAAALSAWAPGAARSPSAGCRCMRDP